MKYCFFIAALAVLSLRKRQVPRLVDGSPIWAAWRVAAARADLSPNRGSVPGLGQAEISKQTSAMKQNDLDARCLPPGVPRIMLMARPFEIVQTPNRILFVYEGGAHVWRQVWMDGRAHPKDPNPNWLGHSIGHWEGDTLVVDSVGFNDRTWLDDAGHPHTEQLHVIEKYYPDRSDDDEVRSGYRRSGRVHDPGPPAAASRFTPARSWRKTSAWTRFRNNAQVIRPLCGYLRSLQA